MVIPISIPQCAEKIKKLHKTEKKTFIWFPTSLKHYTCLSTIHDERYAYFIHDKILKKPHKFKIDFVLTFLQAFKKINNL